jgi:hypothetical protein
MSVKITITGQGGEVKFSDPNPQQNDLVFWNNQDTQPHFPVPGCSGLQVAPGRTTRPYQPFPNPGSPIEYGCAIPQHENEKGTLTIQGLTASTPSQGATKTIEITRSGAGVDFTEVDIHQADSVLWTNKDREDHWPVPNCTGLRVDPGGVTNPLQPAPKVAGLPMPLTYGCAIGGHENESGTINIYNNFTVVANGAGTPIKVSSASPLAAVATGGKSPYKLTSDPRFSSFLSLQETAPAGSSAGVSIMLTAPPQQTGQLSYQLNAVDALGTAINQVIVLGISQ